MRLPSLDEIDQELARRRLLAFTTYTMPGYQVNWHHELVCDYLDRFAAGDIKRLMIFQPPRTGKSELVSRRLPAFMLGRNPDLTIIAASYGADLARRMNRDVQRIIDSEPYRKLFSGTQLSGKNVRADAQGSWLRNSDMFEVVGRAGYYIGVGVGGAVTGMGAHCLTGETRVKTEIGDIDISTLVMLQYQPKVWAFDHKTNRPVLRRIVATRKTESDEILEISTVSGRRIRATAEHRFYVHGQGYKEAALLRPGDILEAITVEQDLCNLRQGQRRWESRRNVRRLLPTGAIRQGASDVRMVRQGLRPRTVSARKSIEAGNYDGLLQPGMFVGAPCREECQDVRTLRQADAGQAQQSVLLARVQDTCESPQGTARSCMRVVRDAISSSAQQSPFLFKDVCECSAFRSDAREGQFELQDWYKLREMVCGNASVDFRTRHVSVRCMPSRGANGNSDLEGSTDRSHYVSGPSYRRQSCKQHAGKPHNPLQDLPRSAPQVCQDAVAVVRHLCAGEVSVYDLQVEECHNFFAEGILTHNCAIIDDPVKNRKEANSPTYQAAIFDWYTSTLYTRLTPDGQVLLTVTRWHENDLAGRLLKLADTDPEADQWEVVKLPAIAEEPVAHYDQRRPGEALWATRWGVDKLRAVEKTVGSRDWASLYQQRPAPDAGDIFKRSSWRYWQPAGANLPPVLISLADGGVLQVEAEPLPLAFDEMLQSWDLAFKKTDTSDFVAGLVLGRKGANKYLLDYICKRLDVTETMRAIAHFTLKWPKATAKLIEDKANGPAVVTMLKGQLTGLIAVEPEGGKVSRAYAAQPEVEAGNVYLPHPALCAWVDGFITNCAAFPNAANDDDVDAFTQAIIRWQGRETVAAGAAQVTTGQHLKELFG